MEVIGVLFIVLVLAGLWYSDSFFKVSSEGNSGIEQWSDWLNRSDVLIVDTETTGFDEYAEVIEVAVLDTKGELRFHALSLPEESIPRKASGIHGLTRVKLKAEDASPWPDIHGELAKVLNSATALLAWNADFDKRLLEQTANRHQLKMPWFPWHDLISDYRMITKEPPQQGRHTLDAVARRLDVVCPTHRALGDCRTKLEIMRQVVKTKELQC